jgi:hypothetical protein
MFYRQPNKPLFQLSPHLGVLHASNYTIPTVCLCIIKQYYSVFLSHTKGSISLPFRQAYALSYKNCYFTHNIANRESIILPEESPRTEFSFSAHRSKKNHNIAVKRNRKHELAEKTDKFRAIVCILYTKRQVPFMSFISAGLLTISSWMS